jgi:hypothetical protein
MIIRAALTLACVSLISCAAAPAPAPASAAQAAPAATAPAAPAPAAPKTNAALEPLAFMTGAWTQAQANGAMIEEHWMAPRGSSMLGSFRRILGNGAVPFYEFTQIVAEKDRVILRQMHVHGNFEPDPKRVEPMLLVLEKAGGNRATFIPAADPTKANAGDLSRVTYFLDGPDMLVLVVEPKAAEGKPAEKPLEFRMSRVK